MIRSAPALLAVILAVAGSTAPAAAADPDPKAPPRVVLYTVGSGESPFEAFGHAALCLQAGDGAKGAWCYDYGTAYFEDFAGLLWGFLRGRAEFQVTAGPEQALLIEYTGADRTIRRQDLPLSPEQAREVARRLREDTRDPSWRYRYHHFRDNCATRIRDVLDGALGGALREATAGKPGPGATFRGLARGRFGAHPALLLMTDLTVGREADDEPDRWEAMFLPDLLMAEVERFFGVAPAVVYERRGPDPAPDPGWGGRGWFLLLGLLLAAPLAAARRFDRLPRAAAVWAVVPLAILGLAVWVVAMSSALGVVRGNEMLVVFLPLDLAPAVMPERWRRIYARVRIGTLAAAAMLLAVGVLHQPLWMPLLAPFAPMAVFAFVDRRPRPSGPPMGRAP